MNASDVLRSARQLLSRGWSGPVRELDECCRGSSETESGAPCAWYDEGVHNLDVGGAMLIAAKGDDDVWLRAWAAFERAVAPMRAVAGTGPDADVWLRDPHRLSVEVLGALDKAILRAQMGERT